MAMIAKGLVHAKQVAMTAYHLVAGILKAPQQASERDAVLRLLADMQGVCRLPNLLCPALGLKDGRLGHLLHTCNLCCAFTYTAVCPYTAGCPSCSLPLTLPNLQSNTLHLRFLL